MKFGMMLRRTFILQIWVVIAFAASVFLSGNAAHAQTLKAKAATPTTPQISDVMIRAEIEALEENATLSEDEKKQITDLYKAALGYISAGNAGKLKADNLKNQRERALADIKNLDVRIKEGRNELETQTDELPAEYKDFPLIDLEQRLVEKSSRVGILRSTRDQNNAALQALLKRPTSAQAELLETQQRIDQLTSQTAKAVLEDASALERAGYAQALGSLFARQSHKQALDQEIASIPLQNQVLARRNSLIDVQIQQVSKLIKALQTEIEAARSMSAAQRLRDSMLTEATMRNRHPVLAAYARKNVELDEELLEISQSEDNIPEVESKIQGKIKRVKADATVANQIIDTGKVNRNYGVHLRKLRNKQPRVSLMYQQIKARDAELEDALFQSIINQEKLQNFNSAPFSVEEELALYNTISGPLPSLTEKDSKDLRRLHTIRRETKSELAAYASLRANKLQEVNILQTQLLTEVQSLSTLLDQRLLWLPSTEPIGFKWPAKVAQGVRQTLNPDNVSLVARSLGQGVKTSYLYALLALLLLGVARMWRARFRPQMKTMAERVGRVQKDSYSLTPIAILDGVFAALPWVSIPIVVGLFFSSSVLQSGFSAPIVRTCFIVGGIVLVGLSLREWCRKGALFDLHFHVDRELRRQLVRHIPWLLGTQILSVILIGLASNGLEFDSGVAALGVLGFLIGTVSISYFTMKIAWGRNDTFKKHAGSTDGIYLQNERWFFIIAIVFPIITAALAVFGYYETARLLLTRFFLTFCALIIAYIFHGLLHRSVVIAQRRLALEQARVRRDRAVKVRMERAAAEERGEIVVPKVDTESIDLETISRQSRQLVNVSVLIGIAAVLWTFWGSLLPALSVFNDVVIKTYTDAGGVEAYITLWNAMQAFGIGLMTWLAARNIPGFLEIFLLKRLNMTQGSRFAIVTVLGYIIFFVGILSAFNKLGTQWSQLQWIVAALGVGIGFGLQAIFANFISGLILLFERPIRIGDFIGIGGISGTVTRIQIRATTLLDLDNKEILIPNQELISQQVINWTLTNPVTRITVSVGIAYGSDTAKAHKIMLETVNANPYVLKNPEPTALFLGFGDSSLDFEIRIFLRNFVQRFMVSHEVHMALDAALREAGIEIAFPQRDLHIKNPEALPVKIEPDTKKVSIKKKPSKA